MKNNLFAFLIKQTVFILLLVASVSFPVAAQKKVPVLERVITIRLSNIKLDAALSQVAQQGGFTFSYNPSLIDINRTVNLTINNKTIREVLNMLFNGKITTRVKGEYVILVKAKEEVKKVESKKETFTVTGYVLNESGEKLSWASVYNKQSLASSVSDAYGFYKIELPVNLQELTLNASKKDYLDTLIQLKDNTSSFLNITLTSPPGDTVIAPTADSSVTVTEQLNNSFFMSEADIANTINIRDTLYRKAQASFVPFIGSNGRLSGIVINDYSLNVIGGYSMGTHKLELGGVFNVNRGDVKFCQLAGFSNTAGGNVTGCQLAGFLNTVRKDVRGVQGAGFVNVVWGGMHGAQLAGFVNVTRSKSKGVQAAGFVNTVLDTSSGVQLAGFVNVSAKSYSGTQAAGFVNTTAGEHHGTQVAGFVNVATAALNGMQIGCVNYARDVKGTQLGLFNYAKSCSGVPLGLISYVNNGYHKVEVSADEVFHLNFAFRSGVTSFHNILTAGIDPANFNTARWTFGYGLGTTILIGKNRTTGIDFDITSNQVVMQGNFDKINLVNKAYVGMDVKVAQKASVAFGLTVNGQLTKSDYDLYPQLFSSVKPNIFYSTTYTSSNLDLQMWLGGKVALRFL